MTDLFLGAFRGRKPSTFRGRTIQEMHCLKVELQKQAAGIKHCFLLSLIGRHIEGDCALRKNTEQLDQQCSKMLER
jgi:hypothetical protein